MLPIEFAARQAGLALAHAAASVAGLGEGELLCPFAIVTKDENREVVHFEADTQAEAVERGKASLSEYIEHIDSWAFAREGLWSSGNGDEQGVDVILVTAWALGIDEPLVLVQRLSGRSSACCQLQGAFEVVGGAVPSDELLRAVQCGLSSHPRAQVWQSMLPC